MAHSLRLKVVAEGVETEEAGEDPALGCAATRCRVFCSASRYPRRDDRAPGARARAPARRRTGNCSAEALGAEHGGSAWRSRVFSSVGVIREQRDADGSS